MLLEGFPAQFPLHHAAVVVQRRVAVLQFLRVLQRARFGELVDAVADLARRVDGDPGDDDHQDRGDGATIQARLRLAAEIWIRSSRRSSGIVATRRAPAATAQADQLEGQGVAFGDPGRIGVVLGRERVGAEAEEHRDDGRRHDRDHRGDQLAAHAEEDEDHQRRSPAPPARRARSRSRASRVDQRHRRRRQGLDERRFLAPGGEADAEDDRHRGEDPDRVPVAQRVAQPVVFDRGRDRVQFGEDPGDERGERRPGPSPGPASAPPRPSARGSSRRSRRGPARASTSAPGRTRSAPAPGRATRAPRPASRPRRARARRRRRSSAGPKPSKGSSASTSRSIRATPRIDRDDRRGTGEVAAGAEGEIEGDGSRPDRGEGGGGQGRPRGARRGDRFGFGRDGLAHGHPIGTIETGLDPPCAVPSIRDNARMDDGDLG